MGLWIGGICYAFDNIVDVGVVVSIGVGLVFEWSDVEWGVVVIELIGFDIIFDENLFQ